MLNPLADPGVCDSLREVAAALAPDRVVVVGAAALLHHRPGRVRVTRDVDLAVACDLHEERLPAGWTRSQPPRQRWLDRSRRPIDIVAATETNIQRGYIDWPDGTRMSLVGFDLVMRDSAVLFSGETPNLRVAGMVALAVCKIVAWSERVADRGKDLRDLATILVTYVEVEEARFHTEPDPDEDFDTRAAFLLGVDIAGRGDAHHVRLVQAFVAQARAPDGRLAAAFLREASAVGRWSELLVELRLDALARGTRPTRTPPTSPRPAPRP